jgi:N6-L-threonylcarbamoyladenine synthase
MTLLGLETSCDETAAAVITAGGEILSNVVASQTELHAVYGGVVPEIASRRHLELVSPVVREALDLAGTALDDLDRIAVTRGPGLIGALLVGLAAAKGLAWGRGLPLVPVDHLHGHVASLYLQPVDLEPPFLCLLASGGHTLLLDVQDRSGFRVIGTTLDDAAGEAFDKGARLLGLGYPGGAEIDRVARDGDPTAYEFPVARVPGLDFSFSGVKTALLYTVRDTPDLEARRADLAASYQRAIVRALVERVREAADGRTIAIVGGVAANSELRAALPEAVAAPLELCTDNAAMIASAGRYAEPAADPLRLDAYAVA